MRRWTLAAAAVLATAALSPARLDLAAHAGSSGDVQEPTVTIQILAERFRFSPDQVRIHRGQTVEFQLESDDTDHGFRIVGTDVDRVIPKRGRGTLTVVFKPDRAGRYTFECSKLCGAGHDFMHGLLIVED